MADTLNTYGVAVYGDSVYTADQPQTIPQYSSFSASGQYAIDDLHIVADTLDQAQIAGIYTSGHPQQRIISTVILAPFDGNTEAGDIDFGGLTIDHWRVYRDGVEIAEYENTKSTSLSHTDYTVVATKLYEYSVAPVAQNGVEGDWTTTQIRAGFDGWWLVDETEETYQFLYNNVVGTIMYEEDRAEVRTFASKPFVRSGQYRAERGSIGGLKATREDYEKLRELVQNKRVLQLKSWRGDGWYVNIYNLQRTPEIAGETLSVDWVEVAHDTR